MVQMITLVLYSIVGNADGGKMMNDLRAIRDERLALS